MVEKKEREFGWSAQCWKDEVRLQLLALYTQKVDGCKPKTTINESEEEEEEKKKSFRMYIFFCCRGCCCALNSKVCQCTQMMTPSYFLLLLFRSPLTHHFVSRDTCSTCRLVEMFESRGTTSLGANGLVCSSADCPESPFSFYSSCAYFFLAPPGFSMTSAVSQMIINKTKQNKRKN